MAQLFTYSGSGTVQASGATAHSWLKSYYPSGLVQLSGAVLVSKDKAVMGSGLIPTAGAAIISKDKSMLGSGSMALSGDAQPFPLFMHIYASSGQVLTSSQALVSKTKDYVPVGGLQNSGQALISKQKTFLPTGIALTPSISSAQTAQSASTSSFVYAGSGLIQAGASADASFLSLPLPQLPFFGFGGGGSARRSRVASFTHYALKHSFRPPGGIAQVTHHRVNVFGHRGHGKVTSGGNVQSSHLDFIGWLKRAEESEELSLLL